MSMKWRMTYNNINGAACSARGIAHRESKEALELLAKELEGKIENVSIYQIETVLKKRVLRRIRDE